MREDKAYSGVQYNSMALERAWTAVTQLQNAVPALVPNMPSSSSRRPSQRQSPLFQKRQVTLGLNPRIDSKEGPSAKAAQLFQTLIEELQELKTAVVEVREEVRRSEEARVVFEARMAEEHGCSCAVHSSSLIVAEKGEDAEDHKNGCLPA